MNIAIQSPKNSDFFTKKWIEYCIKNNISFKTINVYSNDIINQVKECDIFLWHFSNYDNRDLLFGKQLLFSLKSAGVKVFPDFNTCWHFDDKIGQKYLLEAIGAPLIPTYIFYNKKEAVEWASNIDYPKVFKLSKGSGSNNVSLVKNKKHAIKKINKAFNRGFSFYNRRTSFFDRIEKSRRNGELFVGVLKAIFRLFLLPERIKLTPREKGYVYFQDYINNDGFDIRVVVIDSKAFALKRLVRKNDFRASGSGNIVYDEKEIDIRCIKIALEVEEKLQTQCLTFDFIIGKEDKVPYIGEISYGFVARAYEECPGYWDKNLIFHHTSFEFLDWIIQNIIR